MPVTECKFLATWIYFKACINLVYIQIDTTFEWKILTQVVIRSGQWVVTMELPCEEQMQCCSALPENEGQMPALIWFKGKERTLSVFCLPLNQSRGGLLPLFPCSAEWRFITHTWGEIKSCIPNLDAWQQEWVPYCPQETYSSMSVRPSYCCLS